MSRRAFLTITAVAGGVLAAGTLAGRLTDPAPVTVRETRFLMGTVIHLAVVTPNPAAGQAALDATFTAMQRLIVLFDHRTADSALGRLNRDGVLLDPPDELVALLAQAQQISARSGGAFDVTVQPLIDAYRRGATIDPALRRLVDYRLLHVTPDAIRLDRPGMAVTLDGVAKGRVIDAAVATLQAHDCAQVLVEAGGDLAGVGTRLDGTPWRVGVAHPRPGEDSVAHPRPGEDSVAHPRPGENSVAHPRPQANSVLAVLDLPGGALATSGDYMNFFSQDYRRHHIIDPRTGDSPQELASVSVMAPTAAQADALSTTLMVLGVEQGQQFVAQWPEVEALFVTKTLEQVQTAGFPQPASL